MNADKCKRELATFLNYHGADSFYGVPDFVLSQVAWGAIEQFARFYELTNSLTTHTPTTTIKNGLNIADNTASYITDNNVTRNTSPVDVKEKQI